MAEVFVEHPPHADGQTALLYERYGTRIYRFCLSRLRSREEAEDAVQSTFLRAHGALRQGVVPHSESAWLFKIAQNVCVTRAVASSRRTKVEHAADIEQVHERIPAAQRQHDELIGLADALADMPPNLRRPFLLREWKGLSYAEIAEDLGVSQSAVETLIFRARRHLAGALDVPASRLRRAVKALHLGPVLDFMRSLLAGGGAAKVAAVAAVATVGAVGVTVVPGSHSRSPSGPEQVTPSGEPGTVQPATGIGTQSSSQPPATRRPGGAARQGTARGLTGPRANGGRLTGTASPTSSAPRTANPIGATPAAGPTGAAPSGGPSPSSGAPTTGAPVTSSGILPSPVVVPPVPLTPPSGSGGLPEVPPLPPIPQVPIPQVPPVPVPPIPVEPPAVPPLPTLTPPPLPVPPPSVPPVPPVPPLPDPPPVPQVVPPPPPVLPPVPPPPPLP